LNPAFQLPVIIAIALLALGFAAWASLRSSAGRPPGTRSLLLGIRLIAIAALITLLLNPGKWVRPSEETPRTWIVLQDVSASMAQPTADGKTRADHATALAKEIRTSIEATGQSVRHHPFADTLDPAITPTDPFPPADREGTHILSAISQTLQDASSTGESLSGIFLLSDGRETREFSQTDLDAMALRARARNTAVHTIALGADSPSPDIALLQNRSTFTAFPEQSLRIPFGVESTGLEPIRTQAILRDATGTEIATLDLELPPNQTLTTAFDTTAPAESTRWSIEIPLQQGEVRAFNNHSTFNLRIIESKTRIFLAEGAPYWDSKFLAQLLRQQPHMELNSVHRLTDQRYFRIDTGSEDPSETDHPVFPSTLDELSRYDLIIFGKNIDSFLTIDRLEALRAYVRDHGGAVLFARGRATTSENPALEPLEPVAWTNTTAAEFRFLPTRDGEAAGLFGEALPAPDSPIWASLPTLQDGRMVSLVKPFTRVLAEGRVDGAADTASARFPALLMRRYGQGVAGLVNGDGAWKWDFFPDARELGNHYEDFWIQLIQWMASYSEFLPGQDFSLRLPATRGPIGQPVTASISYRGAGTPPAITLRLTDPEGTTADIAPASIPDPTGRPQWRASFTPHAAGEWTATLIDPRENPAPTPTLTYTVPSPPTESDDLSPDPDFLEFITTSTAGTAIKPGELATFLRENLAAQPPETLESGAIWQPSWNRALIALLIAALFSTEWLLRRRQGLA